jgi:hypothetical protein
VSAQAFSSQRDPALDHRAIVEREHDPHGARDGALAEQRPVIVPAAAAVEIGDVEARDAAGKGVGRGRDTCGLVEVRPVEHLDRAVAQPVAEALSSASRLQREFWARARDAELRVAARVGARDPCGLDRGGGAHLPRLRAPHVGFEPRKQGVESAPALRFGRKPRLAFGQRRHGAIAEDRDERKNRERDQKLDQREPAVSPGHRCGGVPT